MIGAVRSMSELGNLETILREYWMALLPLVLLQYGLAIFAAIHVAKHRHYRFGNIWIWLILVLFVQFIGPILYFAVGRGEADSDEGDLP